MKVLLLGIDALDCSLLDLFGEKLPNFHALRESAKSLKVISTFPPDSDTAWSSIMTGLNPAQHGVVKFIDPLEKSYQILNKSVENEILRGKTFWEVIGNAGYKTYAVFPHLCYPVWETPGVMVARGSSIVDVQSNKPEILETYPNREILMGIRGFPERSKEGMSKYFQKLCDLANADAEFALQLMNSNEWDLFFAYWSTIDATGHFFWNYYDKDDPSFEEGNPFQDVIFKTYQLYDAILGKFLTSVPKDTTVLVLSDHGHGARPFNLVNVNEVLKQAGFLVAHSTKRNPHLSLFEKLKRLAVKVISRYGLARIAGKIMRNFPKAMQGFTRPALINWEKTIAYATDMSGVKSYSYGGIIINREALNGQDYEACRQSIIEHLKKGCVLPDGTELIDFIKTREELYSGPFIDKYPDIILQFKYGYGVGWAINSPLITRAASYNLVPGSHRGDTGTCIIRSTREIDLDSIDLHDITPSLLDLMGVESSFPLHGKSVFKL